MPEPPSSVCRLGTFDENQSWRWDRAMPSLPAAAGSDGPPAAPCVGHILSDHPAAALRPLPPWNRVTAWGLARLGPPNLPSATRKPCAAAARSPEHRLAERLWRQVNFGRSPMPLRGDTVGGERSARRLAGCGAASVAFWICLLDMGIGLGGESLPLAATRWFYATPSAGGPATPHERFFQSRTFRN